MRASFVDSLQNLFPDSPVPASPLLAARLDAARGTIPAIHVLLNDLPVGRRLHVTLKRGGRDVDDALWYRLIDVPVEENTGLVGFIEKTDKPNPHVIRRAPFRVYDAIAPLEQPTETAAPIMALRLELPIAASHRPGASDYSVRIACGSEACDLQLSLVVHRAVVPPPGRDTFGYINEYGPLHIANHHGLKPWSAAHWRMIEKYARLMVRGRQNTCWVVAGSVFELRDNQLVLNRERLRKMVRLFDKVGIHYITGGQFAGRKEWTAPRFTMYFSGIEATSFQGHAQLAGALRQLMQEIDRLGLRQRWLQHVADEPVAQSVADYRILSGIFRKHLPGIRLIEAVDATSAELLAGAVDVWCPQPQWFQRSPEALKSLQAGGDWLWFYTCCFPGGPWLNRLLDMELLRPALLGWAAARFGMTGYLHWTLNRCLKDQDPFKQSVVPWQNNQFLPAGDTHVVYPGAGGPWSGLRFEAQREGIEDYELLRQLQARRPKKAQAIIAKVLRAFDDYTKDVTVYRAARRELLEALDAGHRQRPLAE